MSLIADALKAAQNARRKGPDQSRARRVLATQAGNAVRMPDRSRRSTPRSLLIAGSVFAAAVVVLVGVVLLAPDPPAPERVAVGTPVAQAQTPARSGAAPDGARAGPTPGKTQAAGDARAPAGAQEGAGLRSAGRAQNVGGTPAVKEPATTARQATTTRRSARRTVTSPEGQPASPTFQLSVEPGPGASELFSLGVAAQRRGDLSTAVSYYERALAANPNDVETLNNLGTAFRAMGRLADAETRYRRAIALDPRYAAAWSNLGVVLDAEGRSDEAAAAYREALRRDPQNAGAKVNLAQVYQARGDVSQARRLLDEVLETDSTVPEAHYALARLLEGQGDVAAAARHYEAFLRNADGRFPKLEPAVRQRLAVLKGGSP